MNRPIQCVVMNGESLDLLMFHLGRKNIFKLKKQKKNLIFFSKSVLLGKNLWNMVGILFCKCSGSLSCFWRTS